MLEGNDLLLIAMIGVWYAAHDFEGTALGSKATVCAVTGGNIAELTATAFRTIGYGGEQCSGGPRPMKTSTMSTP
jgi:hypothetical protein